MKVKTDRERAGRWGRWSLLGACLAAVVASLYLWAMILGDHFEIAYVASYSSKELPLMYKVSAFWAGQQGSLLLWLLIHALASLYLCHRGRMTAAGLTVYSVLESLLVILVLAKSPFVASTTVVQDGVGLNPLLQDPWMAVHPPIIFIGYALLAVPFAYALGALLKGEAKESWLEPARRWALLAWGFLGAGVFIGGYWAYKVLGWGGYWGWDPVENSSLVPWLLVGVFIHVLHVAKRRPAALSALHLSVIFTFALVIYGTFLTRSGILGDFSVHSFSGTSIGMTLAVVNAIVLIGGLVLLAIRREACRRARSTKTMRAVSSACSWVRCCSSSSLPSSSSACRCRSSRNSSASQLPLIRTSMCAQRCLWLLPCVSSWPLAPACAMGSRQHRFARPSLLRSQGSALYLPS